MRGIKPQKYFICKSIRQQQR